MSTQTSVEPEAAAAIGDAQAWLATPLGRYLLERERAYFDKTVADVFGYNALQIGLPDEDFLRASRITLRARVDRTPGAHIAADAHYLPIMSNSIDLLLLPHVLEFSDNPHQILREAERVLMPDGQVIVTCFNPMSLWGMRRWFGAKNIFPWTGKFIHLLRLKDWLALLGFEVIGGEMGCYAPPCRSEKWLSRFRFMEPAGDRWWPFSGAVIFLHAVKRVTGMRVITPKWSERLSSRKRLAVVPQKQEEQLAARTRTEAQ